MKFACLLLVLPTVTTAFGTLEGSSYTCQEASDADACNEKIMIGMWCGWDGTACVNPTCGDVGEDDDDPYNDDYHCSGEMCYFADGACHLTPISDCVYDASEEECMAAG